MKTYLSIAQIVVSIVLILVILLQVRGGGLGGLFGSSTSSAFRARRGIEKILFRVAIFVAVVFLIVSILSVRFNP